MRKWLKRIALLIGVVVLAGVALLVHTMYFKPLMPRWFYERVFLEFALDNPEILTSMGMLRPLGLRYYDAEWGDRSPAQDQKMLDKLKNDLATLRRYDRADMTGQAALSYDILEYFLDVQARGERWQLHNFPVNQLFGVQSNVPTFLATQHRIEDQTDVDNYLARLEKLPQVFDQVLQGLRLREDAGVLPPRFTVEKVLTEMRNFVDQPATENILYTAVVEKLDKLPAESACCRDSLPQIAAQIESAAYPAYAKLIAYFEHLQTLPLSNDGVWRLPNGDEYYAWEIESNTTTTMSADEIHAIGLAEVARIEQEMDAILQRQGLAEGSIGERVQTLAHRPDQLYPDTEAGREQILADYQAIYDDIDPQLDRWFSKRPKAPLKVERIPAFKEATSPGAYYNPPSMDGSRPGIFYANLREVSEIPRFGMRTLAFHEGIPGHHFQIALASELEGLPMFRTLVPFTAYSEGWALYSEFLAHEAGFHPDELSELGRLQAEMFRAVRLVVDTGMHAKRWSREQAIDFMRDKTGMGEKEVVAEIERYLVNPGQALAYKIGMLKIMALRQKAEQSLGNRFDIREFHRVVLLNGAMPMPLLEREVDRWISETGV
ncbi:MAG: DUF885 domain-containing protein [Xanthomonadales bacterium]|nr:DUF885 domain-containing protein [Xanthomonadales bacterium]MCB1628046.1 DUF885 domain-containing protein [Xanthomonadales bacterium]